MRRKMKVKVEVEELVCDRCGKDPADHLVECNLCKREVCPSCELDDYGGGLSTETELYGLCKDCATALRERIAKLVEEMRAEMSKKPRPSVTQGGAEPCTPPTE